MFKTNDFQHRPKVEIPKQHYPFSCSHMDSCAIITVNFKDPVNLETKATLNRSLVVTLLTYIVFVC